MQRDELLGLVNLTSGVEVQEPTSVMEAVNLEDLLRQDPELAQARARARTVADKPSRLATGTPVRPLPALPEPDAEPVAVSAEPAAADGAASASEETFLLAPGTGTAVETGARWSVVLVSCVVTLGAGVMFGMLIL